MCGEKTGPVCFLVLNLIPLHPTQLSGQKLEGVGFQAAYRARDASNGPKKSGVETIARNASKSLLKTTNHKDRELCRARDVFGI